MGYDDKRVGYRLLSLETGRIVTARHGNVKCFEDQTVDAKFVEELIVKSRGKRDYIPSQLTVYTFACS